MTTASTVYMLNSMIGYQLPFTRTNVYCMSVRPPPPHPFISVAYLCMRHTRSTITIDNKLRVRRPAIS